MNTLPQSIRTTIELAAGQPRSRAWEIFRSIVESRLRYSGTVTRILEGLAVEEELFGNTFTFSASYRFIVDPMNSILDALPGWYTSAGIGQPLNTGRWETWSKSLEALQSHRGLSGLTHDPGSDQIIDMCSETFMPEVVDETARVFYAPPASTGRPISNRKPTPSKSYIRFDTFLETTENVPTTVQVVVAPDDLVGQAFDPKNPEATLGGPSSAGGEIDRFVETQSGRIEFVWRGYAERVGYPIPRPDKLKVGGYELRRTGRGSFLQGLIGNMLGQAVYAAAWAQRYVVSKRPKNLTGLNGFNDPDQ